MNTSNTVCIAIDQETKPTKKLIKMLTSRIDKDRASFDFIYKYDNYPFNEMRKYQTQIKKHNKIINDSHDWIRDLFKEYKDKPQQWDDLVSQCTDCLDSWGYDSLMDGF